MNQTKITNELFDILPKEIQDKFNVHFYEFLVKNSLSVEQKESARILAFFFYQNGLIDGQA